MGRVEEYRSLLRKTQDWDALLRSESRLPGPRANLELAWALAEEGERGYFEHLRALDSGEARMLTADHRSAWAVRSFGHTLV